MSSDIPSMKPFAILFRHTTRSTRSTLGTSRLTRFEVPPPSLRHAPQSLWQRAMFWLLAPAPGDTSPPLNRLPAVRDEFRRAIHDIKDEARYGLVMRVAQARSLRELWHMRIDVYNLVALHHSEFEASQRLALLNRHFPTRAPRSGFAPLAS
jgi:hypothetical protein